MKIKLLAIGITLVFLIVGFIGCTELESIRSDDDKVIESNDEEKFIGTWKSTIDELLTFVDDGTIIGTNGENGNWKLNDGKLILTLYSKSFVMNYYFSDNDNTLNTSQVEGSGKDTWKKV